MARQVCEDKSRETASSSTGLIFYTDMSSSNPTIQTHIQAGFVSEPPADMFNTVMWKSFLGSKPGSQHAAGPSSSSKTMNDDSSTNFYHQNIEQDFTPGVSVSETTSSENLILHDSSSAPWQDQNKLLDGGDVDDSSLRCVFPCDHVHERRPCQGLSLSLSSTNNPSNIGLQSFELSHTTDHHHHQQQQPQQQQMLQDGYLMNTKAAANINYQGQIQFLLKNSKFLLPLQDLLNEFCSLGIKQNDLPKQKSQKNKNWEEDNGMKYSLSSLEFVELQKRKTKLLSMLEEVERRYRHYCNQMKGVVSTFEAVAGNGAAIVYSALALKTMSRHFRCLKEGILDQIQATRKAMGEKDPVTPGATRGETPRLRILDRALRQQRAFQQINMMETHPWRPQRGLPERSVSILRAWLFEHFLHPYPSDVDKHILARQTGLSRSQVSNWFINARVRLWKPMVEEMYMEEEKEQQRNAISSEGGANTEEDITICTTDVQNPISPTRNEDQKPAQVARLLRIDSECVSSIINNTDHKNDPKSLNPLGSGRATDTFGSVDLDFSSYTHHSSDMVNVPYTSNDHGANQSFHGGGGVSLTLGLQQHGGSGVSLAFPAATVQSPMFFTRDQIEECQTVQYSLLDSEGQNMPYRNLMGTQLLHDLA